MPFLGRYALLFLPSLSSSCGDESVARTSGNNKECCIGGETTKDSQNCPSTPSRRWPVRKGRQGTRGGAKEVCALSFPPNLIIRNPISEIVICLIQISILHPMLCT